MLLVGGGGILSQSDTTSFAYNNALTGMFINNATKTLNLNFSGDNNITKGNRFISSNTTYSFGYTTKVINHDVLQKINIGYDKLFVSYIFNNSLTRGLKYDNFIGLGYGHKWKYMSLSYAAMFENVIYSQKPTTNVFRHSIRGKLKYDYKSYSISAEYYYQPNMIIPNDVIIYGTLKIIFQQKTKLSFTITDIVNYRSINTIKLIHTISLGVNYNIKRESIKK